MQRFFVYPEWLDSHNQKDKVEVVKCADHEQALADKDAAYQQLMGQAIAIAEFATRHKLFDLPCKFLASPEAQAFLKEREGNNERLE